MPASPSPIRYMGAFDPNTPSLNNRYHFGLIWDGTGVDTAAKACTVTTCASTTRTSCRSTLRLACR